MEKTKQPLNTIACLEDLSMNDPRIIDLFGSKMQHSVLMTEVAGSHIYENRSWVNKGPLSQSIFQSQLNQRAIDNKKLFLKDYSHKLELISNT